MTVDRLESAQHRVHDESARLVVCAFAACGRTFALCTRCDRGNKYCSKRCAAAARRIYLVAVRRKYATSSEGREDHRARMERYREERRRARRVVDLCRQKPGASRNVPQRSGPVVMETVKDSGAKAGLRVPPPMERESSLPATPHGPRPQGVRCAHCRRVVLRVYLEPPDRH